MIDDREQPGHGMTSDEFRDGIAKVLKDVEAGPGQLRGTVKMRRVLVQPGRRPAKEFLQRARIAWRRQ